MSDSPNVGFSLSDFLLTDTEKLSPVWSKLSGYLTAKLSQLRQTNDGALDEMHTAIIRGHIQCLKALLALGNELPKDS